jgi:hypothetical protein
MKIDFNKIHARLLELICAEKYGDAIKILFNLQNVPGSSDPNIHIPLK